jgi:hypothetical protein
MARSVRSARESARSLESQWGIIGFAELPSWGLICRLVVPGWAQIYNGQSTLGRGLLVGFGFCTLSALLCFGSAMSSVLLGLAFACHGISVYDVARRSSPVLQDRVFRVLLGCGMLATLLYLPAYSLVTQFVDAIVIQQNRTPLMAGDVLLLRRSAFGGANPRIGSVVQYQIPRGSLTGRTPDGYAARYVFEGARIDRVLAGSGQAIEWDGRRLIVDGQPSSWLPLNPQGAPQPLNFTVPDDCWLILPSTEFLNSQFAVPAEEWKMWSTVRTYQIEGRVIWRSWPLLRMGYVTE